MAMHNNVRPHEEKKPCFVCGAPTPALERGQIQLHPRCQVCKQRLADEFDAAVRQQKKQDIAFRKEAKGLPGREQKS